MKLVLVLMALLLAAPAAMAQTAAQEPPATAGGATATPITPGQAAGAHSAPGATTEASPAAPAPPLRCDDHRHSYREPVPEDGARLGSSLTSTSATATASATSTRPWPGTKPTCAFWSTRTMAAARVPVTPEFELVLRGARQLAGRLAHQEHRRLSFVLRLVPGEPASDIEPGRRGPAPGLCLQLGRLRRPSSCSKPPTA